MTDDLFAEQYTKRVKQADAKAALPQKPKDPKELQKDREAKVADRVLNKYNNIHKWHQAVRKAAEKSKLDMELFDQWWTIAKAIEEIPSNWMI